MKIIPLKAAADGEILLKEDGIQINDKSSRMNSVIFRGLPFLFLSLGAYFLVEAIFSSGYFQLYLNILTGVLFLFVPVASHSISFRRTNKKEIKFFEIEKVSLRKILGTLCLEFHLKNNATRRVYNINNLSDWETIKEQLAQHDVSCS